jgi:hypothetical protein
MVKKPTFRGPAPSSSSGPHLEKILLYINPIHFIKMDPKKNGCEVGEWVHVAQDSVQ